jgi:multiple sugar transport system permease protein
MTSATFDPTRPASLATQSVLGLSRRSWREALAAYVMLLPWVVGFLGFTLIPILLSMYFSFTDFNGVILPPRWVGSYNYEILLEDIRFQKAVYNTIYYAALSQPLVIVGALFIAVLLNQDVPGRTGFRTIFYLPAVLPEVPRAMLWLWLLNPRIGLINMFLRAIGIDTPPNWLFDADWAKPAMVIMRMWSIGDAAIIFLAGLQGIPDHLLEAAEVDGANRWQRFWNVSIPLLSPTIFFMIVTGLIAVFQIFGAIYVWSLAGVGSGLSAGPQDSLLFYAYYLYKMAFQTFQMGRASAMAWILTVFILSLTLIQFYLARRWVYYEAD